MLEWTKKGRREAPDINAVIITYTEPSGRYTVESRRVVDRLMKERAAEMQKQIEEEWAKRAAEFNTGDREEDFFSLLQYMLSIPVRVLVERFGWRPAANGSDGRYRLVRFADYVIEELERISGDDLLDIRKYSEETAERYGVIRVGSK